jgi:hypothetical protein
MERKKAIGIAIISLIIAAIGLIVLGLISYFSSDLLVKLQIGTIIYLSLLSLGIFYQNHKEKLVTLLPQYRIIVDNFGYIVFILFAFDLIFSLVTYWMVAHSIYLPIIASSAVAVGLYFANDVFRQI